jgi:hypothetical protein
MSGYASVFVGCKGPLDEERNDIIICHDVSCVSRKEANFRLTNRLPKGEENNQLDTQDLQERFVFSEIVLELEIELNQAKHCN